MARYYCFNKFVINFSMNRPISSKNKSNGFWAVSSKEGQQELLAKPPQTRKHVRVIKPDLTTNDFGRILPKRMYKDKERLYSQGLQLKQAYNEISEENVRLKTQLSIMSREKSRTSKISQPEQDSRLYSRQGAKQFKNSEVKGSIGQRQNKNLRGFKRIIRELKEQKFRLQSENKKTKKTVKYLKLSELQIELEVVIQENKRLAEIINDYVGRMDDKARLETDVDELSNELQKEYQNSQALEEENSKLQEKIEEQENKMKTETEKWRAKESRLLRELNQQKRKIAENERYVEDLKKEIKVLVDSRQSFQPTKKNAKPGHRSIGSSNLPQSHNSRFSDHERQKNAKQQIEVKLKSSLQTQSLTKEIEQLKSQLSFVKSQLQKQRQSKKTDQKAPATIEQFSDSNINVNKFHIDKQKFPKAESDINIEAAYEEEFQPVEELKVSRKEKQEEQINRIKAEIEQGQEEQTIYKKEQNQEDKKKVGKPISQKKNHHKTNKKMLAQIKQLLTYRMIAQRYPYSDLKSDIQAAQEPAFKYFQLMQMLSSQPFFLKKQYAQQFLRYCYDKAQIDPQQTVPNKTLLEKLRSVIGDFQLINEEQEKIMIIRISQMATVYPKQLQEAFTKRSNGEQTISKKRLVELFKSLDLMQDYIEMIIAELSLCSEDLNHLNFYGFFQRFCVAEDDFQEETIEEEKEESEQSHPNSSRVREGKKQKDSKKDSKKDTKRSN